MLFDAVSCFSWLTSNKPIRVSNQFSHLFIGVPKNSTTPSIYAESLDKESIYKRSNQMVTPQLKLAYSGKIIYYLCAPKYGVFGAVARLKAVVERKPISSSVCHQPCREHSAAVS